MKSWLGTLLGVNIPPEKGVATIGGSKYVMECGVLRAQALLSASQAQTSDTFGFKWNKQETYDSREFQEHVANWLKKYGDAREIIERLRTPERDKPIVLDAGCGAGVTGFALFAPVSKEIRYFGVDVSNAVDVAASRASARGFDDAGFLQASLLDIPIPDGSVDLVYSEGVLHHTDSTRTALNRVARYVRPGGYVLFYVYRKKGPIREFTDDYIREQISGMPPLEAWEALKPLSRFGEALGKLNIEIEVPEPIDLLQIPAGKIDIQTFFYWHVFKAFYRSDFPFEEMHHINYDWYAPINAHRQTPEEVRAWCSEAGLSVEREILEEAGITVVARKSE